LDVFVFIVYRSLQTSHSQQELRDLEAKLLDLIAHVLIFTRGLVRAASSL
jgi:hypothetical protein